MRHPGHRLSRFLFAESLTQYEFAGMIGCSPGLVSAIVKRKKYPGRVLANRIEAATSKSREGVILSEHWDEVDPAAKEMRPRKRAA